MKNIIVRKRRSIVAYTVGVEDSTPSIQQKLQTIQRSNNYGHV